jgi:hypothetical protein
MNCEEAREIMNCLMDGESHPHAGAAREHTRHCRECAEWQVSMKGALSLLQAGLADVPETDISSSVMARLPMRHPASRQGSAVSWGGRRVLAWFCASWFIGLAMLIPAGVAVYSWIGEESMSRLVVTLYHCVRLSSSLLDGIWAVLRALGTAVWSVLAITPLLADKPALIVSRMLVYASLLLITIAFVWFRRRKTVGLFVTLI